MGTRVIGDYTSSVAAITCFLLGLLLASIVSIHNDLEVPHTLENQAATNNAVGGIQELSSKSTSLTYSSRATSFARPSEDPGGSSIKPKDKLLRRMWLKLFEEPFAKEI